MMDETIPPTALLGVLPAHRVGEVADQLAAAGVPPEEIHRDEPEDERTSLRAEMREEVTHSWVAPQAGLLYSKEATKATALVGPVLVAVGILIALPLAFAFGSGLPVWGRILIAVVCGAGVGGTVAVVVLPAMAMKNQDTPSAAQRGTVVRVDRWSREIEEIMVAAEPVRLDRLAADGEVIDAVVTEEQLEDRGIVEELGDNFARESDVEPQHRSR